MHKLFSLRMAVNNIQKNKGVVVPFVLSCMFFVFMFYMIVFLSGHDSLQYVKGGSTLIQLLKLGVYIIGIFSLVFIFYTNSFLFKKRKKEIGLLNTLGLEKIHIIKILLFEILIFSFISIISGILIGILTGQPFVKLIYFLLKTSVEAPTSLNSIWKAALITAVTFSFNFAALFIYYILSIIKSNAINLLKGSSYGEKESKHSKILALFGIIILSTGYIIIINVKSPLAFINMLFLSVALISIGTYLLFIHVSEVTLKILQKCKAIYYRPNNFIIISSMIYRLKQNAIGIANICLLSTAVIALVTGTSSLYAGIEKSSQDYYPRDMIITGKGISADESDYIRNSIEQLTVNSNLRIRNPIYYRSIFVFTTKNENKFEKTELLNLTDPNLTGIYLLTADDYFTITNEKIDLAENEMIFFSKSEQVDYASITLFGQEFNVKKKLDTLDVNDGGESKIFRIYFLIVRDIEILSSISTEYGKNYQEADYYFAFDVENDTDEFFNEIFTIVKMINQDLNVDSRQEVRDSYLSTYAGLISVGVFCSMIFIITSLLIMYYKQISEGHEDVGRYKIIKEIGVEKKYIGRIIKRQILSVFFLPLIVAIVHVIFMTGISRKVLSMLGLGSEVLYNICLVVCIAVFFIIYSLMYLLTSRAYQGIIIKNKK